MSIAASSVKLQRGVTHEEVDDYFWQQELRAGYDEALRLTAEHFGISCAEVEAVTIEIDALNNGNS